MKKTSLLLIIIASLFLIAALPSFKSGDYRIIVENSDKNVDYKADDFYSVYYVYMNVIRALGVSDRLGERDIGKVIFMIIDNLKKGNVVQLQIDKYKGGTLRVTLRSDIAPKKDKPGLWIISNYNAKTKQVVSGEDQKDAYATLFYLVGNKLVKYQYAHEPKTDAELKKMSVNSLADYYLLDGDPGNDKVGRDLLITETEKPGDMPDRAMLYMTLSEYHLLAGKVESAKQSLDKAQAAMESIKDEKRRQELSRVMQYAADLYNYYVMYTGN